MKKYNNQSGNLLVDLFWNLLLVVLILMAAYVFYTRGYLDPYLKKFINPYLTKMDVKAIPLAQVNPSLRSRAAAESAAPTTANSQNASDVVQPEASDTVQPEAADTVQSGDVAGNSGTASSTASAPGDDEPIAIDNLDPRFVPQQVKLLKAIELPVQFDGKVVGNAAVPAGVVLKLVSIQGDKVEVQEGASTKVIPATDTDIMTRVHVLMRVVNAAPAARNTPKPTPWAPTLKAGSK